jgi:hypothetical protein
MFKTHHEFTCPDVLYLQARQKKITYTAIAVYGTIFVGMYGYGKYLERKDRNASKNVNPIDE